MMEFEGYDFDKYPPVETRWRANSFRSRLEARWAIFLQELGLGWKYEERCFNTSFGKYLPDFHVFLRDHPKDDFWLEIKPVSFLDDDNDLLSVDERWDAFPYSNLKNPQVLIVACGEPWSRGAMFSFMTRGRKLPGSAKFLDSHIDNKTVEFHRAKEIAMAYKFDAEVKGDKPWPIACT